MAIHTITTDVTTSQTLSQDDTLYLLQGASIVSDVTHGIVTGTFADENTHLFINGSVFGAAAGIDLRSTTTGNSSTGFGEHTLIVGSTGSIVGAGGAGVDLLGQDNVVINHGSISSLEDSSAGVKTYGDGASIQNHGTIDGVHGILGLGDGDSSDIVNSGTISGRTTAIRFSGQSLNLFNTGLITVAKGSGGGDAIDILNSSSSPNYITNSGTIVGDISGPGDQSLSVYNSGDIFGAILMGEENDLYDGRGGSVTGPVYGEGGNDTYIIDDANIDLIEAANDGTDTVKSTVSYELTTFFEVLDLLGGDDLRGVGNSSNNTINGNIGDNDLFGGGGIDRLNGGQGDDNLRGQKGNDVLNGGDGNDLLVGHGGADKLNGGDGNDILIGGFGKDRLTGGADSDVFRFTKAVHSPNTAAADTITDFVQGEDLIDLAGLSADTLAFIGGGAFGGAGAGEVRVSLSGGNSLVRIDVDGDGAADARILVAGVTTLNADDFLL